MGLLPLMLGVALAATLALLDHGSAAFTVETEPLPPDVIAETLVQNAGGFVVAMAFAPDGRMFYTLKGGFGGDHVGEVRIVENGKVRPTAFVTTLVRTDDDQGVLGITFDPGFTSNHYVYIYRSATVTETQTSYPSNRIVRYTEDATTETALSSTATTLLDVPMVMRPEDYTIHVGGNLRFGSDGKLFVTMGDYWHGEPLQKPYNAQNLSIAPGKIHRLNADGSAPNDNPFVSSPSDAVKTIWGYGVRNPFDFTFDPVGGRLFFTENGPACDDEVNLGSAGGNYGWPNDCGQVPDGTIAPLFRYPEAIGIAGVDFYEGPIASWNDDLFWCAFHTGRLYHGRLDATRSQISSVRIVDGAPTCTVGVRRGPDGALYVSSGPTISRIRPRTNGPRLFLPIVVNNYQP